MLRKIAVICVCFWAKKKCRIYNTFDGSEILHQLRLVGYTMIYEVFTSKRCFVFGISEPSTAWFGELPGTSSPRFKVDALDDQEATPRIRLWRTLDRDSQGLQGPYAKRDPYHSHIFRVPFL